MRCKKAQKLIIAYLDNELSHRKQNAIKTHLAQCPVCSAELESYKKLNGIIEQFPKIEDRSPLFWQNQSKAIEQKVAAVQSGKKPEPTVQLRWHKPVWYKYAAATATISVVAIILVLNQNNQQIKSIVPIEKSQEKIIAAKPQENKPIDEEKKVARLRMIKPEVPKSQLKEIRNIDNISPVETEKAMADKAERKLETTELNAKSGISGDKDNAGINKERVEVLAAAAPAPVAEEKKAAKGANFKAKALGSYAYSTIPAERRMESALGGQLPASEGKAATRESGSMGLARGTAAYFGQQPAEQTLFFDRGTLAQNIQAIPVAAQAKDQLNLAFDSAGVKMMQEAMEMMIQTNFPNQQNQRKIEIKEIPQPAASSPRHIQINMEFNE